MRYWLIKTKEAVIMWLVWHLVPRPIVYWSVIRAAIHAEGNCSPADLKIGDVLQKWGAA